MKRIANFFIILLLSTNLFAECGYDEDFSELQCPEKEGYEQATLSAVSYKAGKYTCTYANAAKQISIEEKIMSCTNAFSTTAENVATGEADEKDTRIEEAITDFAQSIYLTNHETTMSDHFIGNTDFTVLLDTEDTYADIQTYYNGVSSRADRGNGEYGNFISINGIDSHTDVDKTLGAIITGTFTLDPKFFIDGYINSSSGIGELELKPEYQIATLGETQRDTGDGGMWDTMKSYFIDDVAGSMETVDALAFMDRQVLGYLVYLGIGFKMAYMDMIYLILGLGIFWSFGFYMYKKTAALSEKKDDFNMNKTSWLMGATAAIAFFVAPIVNDGNITGSLSDAIYENNSSVTTDRTTNWSSPAQETLRYFLQEGNYFANLISDYGMHAYLTLVSYKQGMMDNGTETAKIAVQEVKSAADRKMRLGADAYFYSLICRDYFSDIEGSMVHGQTTTANITRYYPDTNGILTHYGIGANRLSYEACSRLEEEVKAETNALAAKLQTVRNNIINRKKIYNGDDDARSNFQRYINMMIYAQNTFGWINAPIVPISYFFFKNADYFAYNSVIVDEDESAKIFKDVINNFVDEDIKKDSVQKMAEAGGDAFEWAIAGTVSTSFWMVVPGFSDIYRNINNTLKSFYIGQTHIYNAIKDDGEEESIIKKVLNGAIGFVSGGIGKLTPTAFVGKISEFLTDDKKSAIITVLISVFSMFVSIFIIKATIEAISIAAIAIFLAIKITLYLLEALFFFFAAPAIGLFYAMMNNTQSKNFVGTYFQNLAILAITPVLLTMTTYLIIVVSEFLRFFFLGLINLFTSLLTNGTDSLYSSSDMLILGIVKKSLTIGMIEGISAVFVYIAVLVVATIMIFNFRDWFTKIVGIDSAVGIMKEGGNEIKQGVNKFVNPVG